MIPEAPFLFSIAGLSASLAGLAGLVAGLRRGTDVRPIDFFRLRQIVEFSFANIILAISVVPLSILLGAVTDAVRIAAVAALAYAVVSAAILVRRMGHWNITWTSGWRVSVALLNLGILVAGLAAFGSGTIAGYEALLVALLARPMLAFLLVIASFQHE